MSSQTAEEIVVAGDGDLYIAPYGTTLPTTVDAALDGNFFNLGYTTTDGLSINKSKEVRDVPAWPSPYPVRRFVVSRDDTLTFQLLGWNEVSLGLAWEAAVTEYSSGKYSITPRGIEEALQEWSAVLEWRDGTKDYRYVLKRCTVNEPVEMTLRRDEETPIPITLSALGITGAANWVCFTDDPAFEAGS